MDRFPGHAFRAAVSAVAFLYASWLLTLPASAAEVPPEPIPAGWFVWPAIEPGDGTAIDVSRLNPKPAGAAGRISVQNGHFATAGGQRIRFWGANLSAEVAFPPLDEIEPLARRLAKGGVNIARLHHLDNSWAVRSGGSLWPRHRRDHTMIDPAQLDRLHRLVAALKAQGIYSNINLKVSKLLNPADGFPATVTELPIFQKRVDFFDPRMIELQREYARQLLTPKNPYTGFSLAEDPAVAVVEVNNENSLLGFWTRDLGRGLHQLPEPFRGELQAQWNRWLTRRYADDAALTAAWEPPPPPPAATATPVLPADARWRARPVGNVGVEVNAASEPGAVTIKVERPSGVAWHAQALLPGLRLQDGELYTLAFRAKADQPRTLNIGVGIDNLAHPDKPWRSFGVLETVPLSTDWTPVRLAFSAHSIHGALAALQLNAGEQAGTIEVQDFTLTAGAAGTGRKPDESPWNGSVAIPVLASPAQWADWLQFLADTERAFADGMRRFLREDLGVVAPIACSQIEYGGLIGMWREQAMDFADTHAYWQHPELENGDFDSPNWTIANSPQVAVFGPGSFGELGDRALLRVANKPFALSEYDHAAPTEYACEMYPTLATFAARQDWDALYPFDIGLGGARNPEGRIGRFFDQLHHPAKWGFGPFAALVFRGELIPRAADTMLLQDLPTPVWRDHLHADLAWSAGRAGEKLDFLDTRYAINDRPGTGGKGTVLAAHPSAAARVPGSVLEIIAAPRGKVYVARAAEAAAIVGYIGGATIEAGPLAVTCETFGQNFAALTAVALDGKALTESRRVLVTLVARAQNQGITWNAERTSVGAEWGQGPPIVERVPATITLQGAGDHRVFALAPDGSRAREVAGSRQGDGWNFTVGPEDATIHYEIVAP